MLELNADKYYAEEEEHAIKNTGSLGDGSVVIRNRDTSIRGWQEWFGLWFLRVERG